MLRRHLPSCIRLTRAAHAKSVTVVGSGNWGSVAARIVGQNVKKFPEFDPNVRMWVHEETILAPESILRQAFDIVDANHDHKISVGEIEKIARKLKVPDFTHEMALKVMATVDINKDGSISFDEFARWQKAGGPIASKFAMQLTEFINSKNENVKYLPGVNLGSNVKAVPDLLDAVRGSDVLVFVTPHQFIKGVLQKVKPIVKKDAIGISLIKGMDVTPHGFELISGLIRNELNIDCSVLMGANIANEIGKEEFSEATVGYRSAAAGDLFVKLFNTPYFQVRSVNDVEGAELCGTLKNIVALGCGFIDGLNLGNNSKAAIIRIGLLEMRQLAMDVFPTVKDQTFYESCGVADLITTCFGGRNRKCAEAFVRSTGKETFAQIEARMLGGQKLQGVLTSIEVQEVLERRGLAKKFPLFSTINRIVTNKIPPSKIVEYATLP